MKPFIISKTSGITGLQNKIDIEFSIVNIMSFNQQSSLEYKEHMTMREILGSIHISKKNIFNTTLVYKIFVKRLRNRHNLELLNTFTYCEIL